MMAMRPHNGDSGQLFQLISAMNTESTCLTVEGMINQQTIFVFTFQISLGYLKAR